MYYALELLKKKTPKDFIDGMTNMEWRYRKRQERLSQRSETLKSNAYFDKYKRQVKEKQEKIAQLDDEITSDEEKMFKSIKEGTITGTMKQVMHQHIAKLKKERDVEMGNLESISKNWETAIRKWERQGPPKQKERRPKSSVALQLKSKGSHTSDIDSDNQEMVDITDQQTENKDSMEIDS